MGIVYSYIWPAEPEVQPAPQPVSHIQDVDLVKAKLKVARDKIRNFIDSKGKELTELDIELLAKYKVTKDKKQLLPLLTVKKGLL